MRETAKNYEDRIAKGDFANYLHGNGIDIGGGTDCLKLPEGIEGTVRLWDFQDGDAQYMHKVRDESFDFVYSSHCLEHMRDLKTAFTNWLRICRKGGILYICVPHEKYYEKGIWPSINNADHKYSFTVEEKSSLPANVAVREFLDGFSRWIEVIEIRENLKNYRFDCDQRIDQTLHYEDMVCAQIDMIIRKKEMILSKKWKRKNHRNWLRDYCTLIVPMRAKALGRRVIPTSVRAFLKSKISL